MESSAATTSSTFPRLSCNDQLIHAIYDVIVIGSGCGGAIAACRAARANQGVCVLEKGKEWHPGDFPNTFAQLRGNMHVTKYGKELSGTKSCLFDVQVGDGVTVVSGVGIGGRSLIDAAVCYEPNTDTFQGRQWPSLLRKDVATIYDVDARHVNAALTPETWPTSPPYHELQKTKVFSQGAQSICGADIEDLGNHIKRLPLWINFREGANPFGIEQPACNGCGNCLSGCNIGAKNTLNLNYLADAKAHGAHIFAEAEATSITRDSYTGLWSVGFNRESKGSTKMQTVKARLVFVAAGVTGSAKLLFQSREKGLAVSQKLGQAVTFNPITSGLCTNLTDAIQCVGLRQEVNGKSIELKDTNPGPTTTTAIEPCTKCKEDKDDVIISELTLPAPLSSAISLLLNSENEADGVRRLIDPSFQAPDETCNDSVASLNALPIYATGGEKSFGEITFNVTEQSISLQSNDNRVDYETVKLEEFSTRLGGEFIKWPKEVADGLSMYPLGGCIMGETGCDGVVNHKGQIFIDNTLDVYEGLYVIGSSTLPCDLHINPTFTECMLAERCMRLCAADYSWRADYVIPDNVAKQLASTNKQEKTPGIVFSEKMVGDLTIKATGDKVYCDFVLDVEAENVISMIDIDPEHTLYINGTVTCPGLSKEPLAADGTLKLLRDSKEQVDGKEMIYSMALKSVESRDFYFFGIKYAHLDHFAETGLSDTTILYVTVHAGNDKEGDVIGDGVLYMRFRDFAKQLTTISVTNASSVVEKWKLELKFVKFFLQELWETYFRLNGGSLLQPDAPPRIKRLLNLGQINPEIYKVITEDKIELRLTRLQGGRKGPIMLVHGLGVASSLFLVDTVEQNFVEYLIEQKYDVWLFDWRTSLLLPWACYTQYTVDDCAKYDFPAGVDKILKVTGEKDVQLVIHCFGAIAVMASVLLGKLEGKIRCILTSQVCATPIGSLVNKFKSHGCLSALFANSGMTSFTAYVDAKSPWSEKALNHITRNFAYVTTEARQHCASEVCHRIAFMYGLLFEHQNLTVATHDILHELFGVATMKILAHIALITRKKRLVDSNGKDVYLPGYKKRNRLKDQRFRRKMDLLNVPIMFFNGERNQCWDPENLMLTYNMVREANPTQDYVYFEAKGYGHLDTFLGKKSHLDIYPKLLQWLDKYADNHDVRDTGVRSLVYGALNPEDEHTRIKRTKSGNERLNLIQFDELDDGKEIKANNNEKNNTEIDDDSLELEEAENLKLEAQSKSKISQIVDDNEAGDQEENEIEEEHLLWSRKFDGSSYFQMNDRYIDPESTEFQKVAIESFNLDDSMQRRDIIVLSDLHLGSDWSRNIKPRLESFISSLTETVISTLHSIVLLGNIFDLETTAVAVTPLTKDEFMLEWKKDEVVTSFSNAIQQIAAENGILLYYVRGDSDYDITEEMVKELFGCNVRFITGCLIYKLCIGRQLYTIRFEHGYCADLFNDRSVQMFGTQEITRPFSYFIKRLLYSTEERYFFDSKEVINRYVKATLKRLPMCILGSTFIDILGTQLFSRRFCENLVERAIGKPMTGDECIIMEEGKWIRLKHVFESQFLRNAIAKYGSSEVYERLKSSIRDLSYYVKQCREDVVILGHLHKKLLRRVQSKGGDTIYANTGSWLDLATYHSYVKIQPPKPLEHGRVDLFSSQN